MSNLPAVQHRTADVEGLSVFYREAGDAGRPEARFCSAAFPPRRTSSAT